MSADNFTETLNAFRTRQPYRVFTVELNTGKKFEVDHPGALVTRDGVAVFIASGGHFDVVRPRRRLAIHRCDLRNRSVMNRNAESIGGRSP